jgi:hypothetical protein
MDAQADHDPSCNAGRGKRERSPVPLRAVELGIAYRQAYFLHRHRVRVCRKCGQQGLVGEDVDPRGPRRIRDEANCTAGRR